jgi:hypothetical protein
MDISGYAEDFSALTPAISKFALHYKNCDPYRSSFHIYSSLLT